MNEVSVRLHRIQMVEQDGQEDEEEVEEVVVIIKRTKTVFEAHKEDYYRDKASKRHGYTN